MNRIVTRTWLIHALAVLASLCLMKTNAAPLRLNIERSAGAYRLNWNSKTGITYKVLYSINDPSGPWAELGGDIIATGESAQATFTLADPSGFFRLGSSELPVPGGALALTNGMVLSGIVTIDATGYAQNGNHVSLLKLVAVKDGVTNIIDTIVGTNITSGVFTFDTRLMANGPCQLFAEAVDDNGDQSTGQDQLVGTSETVSVTLGNNVWAPDFIGHCGHMFMVEFATTLRGGRFSLEVNDDQGNDFTPSMDLRYFTETTPDGFPSIYIYDNNFRNRYGYAGDTAFFDVTITVEAGAAFAPAAVGRGFSGTFGPDQAPEFQAAAASSGSLSYKLKARPIDGPTIGFVFRQNPISGYPWVEDDIDRMMGEVYSGFEVVHNMIAIGNGNGTFANAWSVGEWREIKRHILEEKDINALHYFGHGRAQSIGYGDENPNLSLSISDFGKDNFAGLSYCALDGCSTATGGLLTKMIIFSRPRPIEDAINKGVSPSFGWGWDRDKDLSRYRLWVIEHEVFVGYFYFTIVEPDTTEGGTLYTYREGYEFAKYLDFNQTQFNVQSKGWKYQGFVDSFFYIK